MKKLFSLSLLFALALTAQAQVPNLMNYQAVARNAQGQALANQAIKVRLSLIQSDAGGATTFYSETRPVTTNALGLFNVQVGAPGAQSTTGNMGGTNWLDGTKTRSLKVEIDVANNGSFVDMGLQQLVSVPYALAAKEAEGAKKVTAPFIGFRASFDATQNWVGGNLSEVDLASFSELYDSSNVFNPVTGEFTAPESGMYEIRARVAISLSLNSSGILVIRFKSSVQNFLDTWAIYNGPAFRLPSNGIFVEHHSACVQLSQGEKIKLNLYAASKTTDWSINGAYGILFEARKIR